MPTTHYEPGTYAATITKQLFGETQSKNTPYFEIKFVPHTAKAPTELPDDTPERDIKLWMTKNSVEYALADLRRMGWAGNAFTSLDPDTKAFDDLSGTDIEVYCKINDNGYEEWALSKGTPKRENVTGIANALDRMFGKEIKASAPLRPAKITVPQVDPEDAGDSPF